MTRPLLKLTYFGVTGRAELARLALHYGGIPFTDERLDLVKFVERKPTLPLGQVPVLEIDGAIFFQSTAISRYAGKLSGLYPSEFVDALRVDAIVASIGELFEPVADIRIREKNETIKAEKTEKFLEETVPRICKTLEKMVQGEFFMGEKESLADLALFDIMTNGIAPGFAAFHLEAYPKLAKVVVNVQSLPALASYLGK